jgi:hypothetical protein
MSKKLAFAEVAAVQNDWDRTEERRRALSRATGLEFYEPRPPMQRKELGVQTLVTGRVKEHGAEFRMSPAWFDSNDSAARVLEALATHAPDATIQVTISRRRRIEYT